MYNYSRKQGSDPLVQLSYHIFIHWYVCCAEKSALKNFGTTLVPFLFSGPFGTTLVPIPKNKKNGKLCRFPYNINYF